MSSDAGYDFDDPIYKQLEKEASQDNRVGDHEWLVTDATEGVWPSGDKMYKLRGVLTTANNAKADVTLSPPPSPEEIKATISTWSTGKKKGVASTVAMYKELAKHYHTTPEKIGQGDTFKVKTVITRRNADGTGGFVRVVAFLDPKKEAKGNPRAEKDGVPF